MSDKEPPQIANGTRHGSYRWPWFLLAAVVIGILLAIIWMSREVARTRKLRDLNSPAPANSEARALPCSNQGRAAQAENRLQFKFRA